jgi:glycopeptide antibiotics resistance protein
MILLIYFLFFSEEYGRTVKYTDYQYNLTLFRELSRYIKYRDVVGIDYFLINVVGNVVVFMPFGFFVHSLNKKKCTGIFGFLSITAVGFLFSLAVETVQLVTKVGCFDVDDLLLNTIGVALGVICYYICRWIMAKRKKGKR